MFVGFLIFFPLKSCKLNAQRNRLRSTEIHHVWKKAMKRGTRPVTRQAILMHFWCKMSENWISLFKNGCSGRCFSLPKLHFSHTWNPPDRGVWCLVRVSSHQGSKKLKSGFYFEFFEQFEWISTRLDPKTIVFHQKCIKIVKNLKIKLKLWVFRNPASHGLTRALIAFRQEQRRLVEYTDVRPKEYMFPFDFLLSAQMKHKTYASSVGQNQFLETSRNAT